MCERSGAKLKAIKSSVRGHAKHDGKLQQRGEQSSRPVSLFIRRPPPLLFFSFKTDTHGPKNTPLLLFTHPSEANRLQSQGFDSLSRRDSATDKQPRDNPTETSLSTPLPVCKDVQTGKKAIQPASEVFTLRGSL